MEALPYPVPALHTLRIVPPESAPRNTLVDMLKSRHRSGHKVQLLDILGPQVDRYEPNRRTLMQWKDDKEELMRFVEELSYSEGESCEAYAVDDFATSRSDSSDGSDGPDASDNSDIQVVDW